MSEPIHDPRFDAGYARSSSVPMGRYPVPEGSRAVECLHCGGALGLSGWEYINGFLVVCPHCRGFHGKAWGFERTILAGLFLSALSFFFVMRPRRAGSALVAFGLVSWLLMELAARDDMNTALMIGAIGFVSLAPVLVNAIALVRHQSRLDAAPPLDDASRSR